MAPVISSENKAPSVAELQKYVRDKVLLEFLCVDGKSKFTGSLRWFDEEAFNIKQEDGSTITLLRSAVVGYRAKKAK